MKMVLLLRHGKSDWSTEVDDRDRPLAKRGRKAARAMGEFLTRARPDARRDRGVASPRAADTAALAAAAGGWQSPVRTNELLYGVYVFGMLAVARAEPDEVERLMIVGHEPASSEAVAAPRRRRRPGFPHRSRRRHRARSRTVGRRRPGCGRLVYLVPPPPARVSDPRDGRKRLADRA